MKKLIIIFIIFLSVKINFAQYNNWITVGGNSNRSSYNENFFDVSSTFNRTYSAPYTFIGMQIFSYNQYFANTRYISFSPVKAVVATYNFNNPDPIWTYETGSGVNVIMGFNDNKIYVRDFQQDGSDSIFALNAADGSVVWRSKFTVDYYIIWTAVFTSGGDLILPNTDSTIMRINHLNGDTVWTKKRYIPNLESSAMCINGNTLYSIQGTSTSPKTIIAIDVNTGVTKYSSPGLAGSIYQEFPFSVSSNGVVYCIRSGGPMYAIKDNGTALTILWSRNVSADNISYSQIAIGKDSTIYIPFGKKIYRLDHQTGAALDSSIDLVSTGSINPRFATGKFQTIFVGNGADDPLQGKFFSFSKDLRTLNWEVPFQYNYYSGPATAGNIYNPHLLMTGAGSEIKAKYDFIDNIRYISNQIPDKSELSQNYPNPFNPVTNFEFRISELGFVTLKVYDILGEEIETLVKNQLNPGSYEVEFNGSKYSSGIYFYRLTIGNFTLTKKMNLIK